jgi:hypothetical protein
MKAVAILLAVILLAAMPAFALEASKYDEPFQPKPGLPNAPSGVRADFEYNTGGYIDFVPDLGGSSDGWGEWFITTVHNNTGEQLHLKEFGFPCAGPPTGDYGWLVWTDVGGMVPPAGDATTADHYGSFTPVDPNPETWPPTVYTYVDVSARAILIPVGAYFCFGYDNTGMGGQTGFNGVDTWSWYNNMWDPDQGWGRTDILQIKADYFTTPIDQTTWGVIKAFYR